MAYKYLRTAALAATLLAGTGALALAQTSSQSPSSGTSTESPKAVPNGSMNSGAQNDQQGTPSKSEQTKPTRAQGSSQPSNQNAQGASHPTSSKAQNASPRHGRSSTTASAPANENVNLTSEQKTVIKNKIIDNKSAPRVSHVDFSVNVGVAVPRTVHLAPVPETIVEIHPAWKKYVYFVYEDEVIIVNPSNRHIVQIIVVS